MPKEPRNPLLLLTIMKVGREAAILLLWSHCGLLLLAHWSEVPGRLSSLTVKHYASRALSHNSCSPLLLRRTERGLGLARGPRLQGQTPQKQEPSRGGNTGYAPHAWAPIGQAHHTLFSPGLFMSFLNSSRLKFYF